MRTAICQHGYGDVYPCRQSSGPHAAPKLDSATHPRQPGPIAVTPYEAPENLRIHSRPYNSTPTFSSHLAGRQTPGSSNGKRQKGGIALRTSQKKVGVEPINILRACWTFRGL